MQQQDITRVKLADDFINIGLGQRLIGTAIEQNTVLRVFVDLDDCMTGARIDRADVVGMNAVLPASVQKYAAVRTDHTALIDLHTGFCQCDRLVHTLSTQKQL